MNTPYDQYTVQFNSKDIPTLYADWDWLVKLEDLHDVKAMTVFGDLFFKHSNGVIYFIDSLEGAVFAFARSDEEFEQRLSDIEVQKKFLSIDAIETLKARGLVLKEDELFIYVPHPLVSQSVALENVQVMSMKVVISLNGQLLRQMTPRDK